MLWAYVAIDKDKKEIIILEALSPAYKLNSPFPYILRRNGVLEVSPAITPRFRSQFKEALEVDGIDEKNLPKLEKLLKNAFPTSEQTQDTVPSVSRREVRPLPSSGSLIPDPA